MKAEKYLLEKGSSGALCSEDVQQIIFELLADKAGKVTAGALNLLHEARVMFRNDRIECGLFWAMPLIGGRGSKWGRSRHRA